MEFTLKRVCVFTADLMRSRELADRRAVQVELLNLIDTLNSRFESELLAKFTMVLGDEFQGVLKSSEKALEVFRFVKKNIVVGFYCGIGVGNINTPLSDNPSEMDGPAFYHSRDALEEAKKKRLEVIVKSGNKNLDSLINTLLQLILYIRGRWSKRQRQIIEYLESKESVTQTDAAKYFGVSKQFISKIVKETGWRIVRKAEELANEYMASFK